MSSKGFAPLILIIIIAAAIGIGVGGYVLTQKIRKTDVPKIGQQNVFTPTALPEKESQPPTEQNTKPQKQSGASIEQEVQPKEISKKAGVTSPQAQSSRQSSGAADANCAANAPTIELTADITDVSRILRITAPGTPTGDQDIVKSHSFIWTDGSLVPVYAPIDAVLDSGAFYTEAGRNQYTAWFRSLNYCGYRFKFDHIHQVTDAIKNALNRVPQEGTKGNMATAEVVFRAGEKIGETTGNTSSNNWDFGFYNFNVPGPLYQLKTHDTVRHAVCWVDYYAAEKKGRYRALLEGPKSVCSF